MTFCNELFDLGSDFDARSQQAKVGAEETFFRADGNGAGALHAFDKNLDIAVGQLHALDDIGESADRVDFLGLGVVDGSVMLSGQENLLVTGEGLFERADAGFAANDERRHLLREDDHIPHRHHGYALQFLFFPIEHAGP